MSTEQILALLFAERDKLNRAIEALGRAQAEAGRLPPVWPPRRRTFTAAQRKSAGGTDTDVLGGSEESATEASVAKRNANMRGSFRSDVRWP
jgi:hypothetical protein